MNIKHLENLFNLKFANFVLYNTSHNRADGQLNDCNAKIYLSQRPKKQIMLTNVKSVNLNFIGTLTRNFVYKNSQSKNWTGYLLI